jgi:two-component system, OmpR family, sensor histidine kinase KdpD
LRQQLLLSVSFVLIVSALCYLSNNILGYRTVAIILLMLTSVLGMLFEIMPVLLSSALSAFIWNFFFIPPVFTFQIRQTEDLLMFLLYFLVAMLNAVLTFKIRKAEKQALEKEEREKTIKLYNTLLNSLTHELRTPIATILGSVDTLSEAEES